MTVSGGSGIILVIGLILALLLALVS